MKIPRVARVPGMMPVGGMPGTRGGLQGRRVGGAGGAGAAGAAGGGRAPPSSGAAAGRARRGGRGALGRLAGLVRGGVRCSGLCSRGSRGAPGAAEPLSGLSVALAPGMLIEGPEVTLPRLCEFYF